MRKMKKKLGKKNKKDSCNERNVRFAVFDIRVSLLIFVASCHHTMSTSMLPFSLILINLVVFHSVV